MNWKLSYQLDNELVQENFEAESFNEAMTLGQETAEEAGGLFVSVVLIEPLPTSALIASPDGTPWQITVSDDGTILVEPSLEE